jgi:hypothetical protein
MSRRPTKATGSSRSNAATFSTGYEKPSTSSQLDLSSANDDDATNNGTGGGGKIHKKSKKQQQKGSSMLLAIVCGFIGLCTLYYVANKFAYMTKHHVNSSLSIHHLEKKQDYDKEPNNNHHHHNNNLQLPPDSIYRAQVTNIYNEPQSLLQYAGSISLIVNVACE